MKTQSVQSWQDSAGSEQVLVDVRTPAEFGAEHADGAVNLPLDVFSSEKLKELAGDKQVGLICQSGTRAKQAYGKAEGSGLDLVLVEGGTSAWVSANLPTIQGKKIMSLERQVRIAAGFLVLSGVVLSKVLLPGMEYLSAFVGAGLIFAGITDTCGMGMLIAKMPWNQMKGSNKECCAS